MLVVLASHGSVRFVNLGEVIGGMLGCQAVLGLLRPLVVIVVNRLSGCTGWEESALWVLEVVVVGWPFLDVLIVAWEVAYKVSVFLGDAKLIVAAVQVRLALIPLSLVLLHDHRIINNLDQVGCLRDLLCHWRIPISWNMRSSSLLDICLQQGQLLGLSALLSYILAWSVTLHVSCASGWTYGTKVAPTVVEVMSIISITNSSVVCRYVIIRWLPCDVIVSTFLQWWLDKVPFGGTLPLLLQYGPVFFRHEVHLTSHHVWYVQIVIVACLFDVG